MGVYALHKCVCESNWNMWKQPLSPPFLMGRTGAAPLQEGEHKKYKSASHWFQGNSKMVGEVERSCDSQGSISFLGLSAVHYPFIGREKLSLFLVSLNSVVINCSKCQIHNIYIGKPGKENNNVFGVYSHFI